MMEHEINQLIFSMGSLGTTAPQRRRGLSRYYSGKTRSFTCIADAECLEDLKKPKHDPGPSNKKRRKLTKSKSCESNSSSSYNNNNHTRYAYRRTPSRVQFQTPYVNLWIHPPLL